MHADVYADKQGKSTKLLQCVCVAQQRDTAAYTDVSMVICTSACPKQTILLFSCVFKAAISFTQTRLSSNIHVVMLNHMQLS